MAPATRSRTAKRDVAYDSTARRNIYSEWKPPHVEHAEDRPRKSLVKPAYAKPEYQPPLWPAYDASTLGAASKTNSHKKQYQPYIPDKETGHHISSRARAQTTRERPRLESIQVQYPYTYSHGARDQGYQAFGQSSHANASEAQGSGRVNGHTSKPRRAPSKRSGTMHSSISSSRNQTWPVDTDSARAQRMQKQRAVIIEDSEVAREEARDAGIQDRRRRREDMERANPQLRLMSAKADFNSKDTKPYLIGDRGISNNKTLPLVPEIYTSAPDEDARLRNIRSPDRIIFLERQDEIDAGEKPGWGGLATDAFHNNNVVSAAGVLAEREPLTRSRVRPYGSGLRLLRRRDSLSDLTVEEKQQLVDWWKSRYGDAPTPVRHRFEKTKRPAGIRKQTARKNTYASSSKSVQDNGVVDKVRGYWRRKFGN